MNLYAVIALYAACIVGAVTTFVVQDFGTEVLLYGLFSWFGGVFFTLLVQRYLRRAG